MDIQDLSNAQLLEEFTDMVRWRHYDPHGSERPSKFDLYDLQAELRRRLENKSSETTRDIQ